MSTISPNMGLVVPTVAVDSGLVWEQSVVADLSILDGHNHANGSGVQINPSGILINSALTFGNNDATNLRSTRFSIQPSPLSQATDLGCLYVSGVDLYFNDENANQVRITSGGNVNATSSGISSGSASASFVSSVLTVLAASSTPANIQGASLLLGLNSSGTNYLTLSPPAGLSAGSYALTLPAIPSVTSFVTLDTSGNLTASAVYPLVSASIASSTIIGSNVSSDINLPGKAVQENGNNLVVSNTNATTSLAIVRATFSSGGSLIAGEGATASNISGGVYNVSFSTSFADTPVITVSAASGDVFFGSCDSTSSSGVQVVMTDFNGAVGNTSFSIIAIGQRA